MRPETRTGIDDPAAGQAQDSSLNGPVPFSLAEVRARLVEYFVVYALPGRTDRPLGQSGRQVRQNKRGSIPAEPAPILERLHVGGDGWLTLVQGFCRMFRRAAGRPASLRRHADKWGRRRIPGIANSRSAFG